MSVELPSIYQNIIHLSRYSRYDEAKGRRETWKETVIDRLTTYLKYRVSKHTELNKEILDKIDEIGLSILNLDTMPSMRLLMTAGPACERDNVAAFNCSYAEMSGSGDVVRVLTPEMVELGFDSPITINMSKPICFDEGMYILLCGTGLGFSCERQIVSTLPVIGHKLSRKIYEPTDENFPGVSADELSIFNREENKIYVADSKYGWASALRILITELYNGNFQISWDLSKVRKAGEPLKTFGGRASGPGPLQTLFNYCVSVFNQANGRKLTSIEVHGIVCKIAEVVVVGGVRRSALISLSNLSDDRMRHAKSGQWWEAHPEFALANNSVAYTEKPDVETYMREFTALIESKSGERGIFNRVSSQKQAARWGRRIYEERYGTNPCSEIILRPNQFCNLTEVIARENDNYETLKRKIEHATILGTIQSTLTDFVYLSKKWSDNTKEENLLGVSITGIMDNEILSREVKDIPRAWYGAIEINYDTKLEGVLESLRDYSREVNKKWSNILGIKESTAITCVKPSGTVSQLVDSASGIHARHNPYYIRRIRMDKKDPMYKFLKEKGVTVEDDVMSPNNTAVFSFPMKAPEGAVCRKDRTALEQLELWLIYQRYWCEHKPSVTISVKDNEWPSVASWVWEHFDEVAGISFLPFSDHTYQQAPYEDITQEQYEDMLEKSISYIDFTEMHEGRDNTEGSQTLACVAGHCEI